MSDINSSTGPARALNSRGLLRATCAAAAMVWVVDQVAKQWAVSQLEERPPVNLVGDVVLLSFGRNPGAAFGIGAGFTIVFTLIAAVVVIAIIRLARRLGDPLWALALGGMLGGAAGNLTDRVFRDPGGLQGHVVDMLWIPRLLDPVFNLADVAITASAALMVVLTLLGRDPDGASRRVPAVVEVSRH